MNTERWTDRARTALNKANEYARLWGHSYVGTEHLMAAAMDAGGVATHILQELGVTKEQFIEAVRKNFPKEEGK